MTQNQRIAEYPIRPGQIGYSTIEPDDEISIDLRDVLNKLWRGKWIITIMMLISGIIAFLVVSQMVPMYRATATVMFDLQANNVVNLDQPVVRSVANENTLQNQIEVLQSTNLIERVIDKLSLDRNPEFNPSLLPEKETLLDKLRGAIAIPPEVMDLLRNVGAIKPPAPPAPPPSDEDIASSERRAITAIMREQMSLSPVQGSKVINISFTSRNPKTAASVANAIAEQYIVDQLDAKLEATRAATNWLSDRVEELRQRVQAAEEAVQSAKAEQSIEAGQSLEITQQQLQAMNAALSVARNETRAAQATYDRLSTAVDDGKDVGGIPEFQRSSLIQSYRAREAELLSQQAALEAQVPEGHPARIRLRTQLEEVRRNMRDEQKQIVAAARSEWQAAKAKEADIQASVRDLETKALAQSKDSLKVRQLEREADASRALYENFLSRLKQTSEQEKLQSADARILSPADKPAKPLSQAKNRTLLLGLIVGAMAGIGIIFLLDKLNNTFRAPLQVETLTGETVLGTIPAIGKRVHRKAVLKNFREKPKSSLAEAIRNLRTSILFSNVDAPPKVVMFTSSVPREGKSTTAMMVAMTSRQMGKSAVILDCDLRLPALAKILDADDGKPGLLSVLEGAGSVDDAIFQDPETGLHVLMTKPSEPSSNVSAADIISSQRFGDLIQELKARYDFVILDAPPTLVVADAKILCAHADTVVYTIRWDHTPRGAVQEGLKELSLVNAPVAGVVLTLVNEARAVKYAYQGYAYYKGRYKDYYVS